MSTPGGPVVLVLFNGWGYRDELLANVIAEADTPNNDQLQEAYPHALVAASGSAVGLSEGTVGSAASGFATIAAGRALPQPSLLVDLAIADGSLGAQPALRELFAKVVGEGVRLHLLGQVSDGRMVSSERHYFALLHLLAEAGVPGERVFVHAILDGHDTPARSGVNYLARFAAEMLRTGMGRVATLMGRTYGMAVDGGWEATERAHAALVDGAGRLVPSAIQAIQAGYSRGEDDTSLSPAVVLGSDGLPLGQVREGDVVLLFNHRGPELERLARSLAEPAFDAFEREERPAVTLVALTEYPYAAELGCRVVVPEPPRPPSVGQRLAAAGKRIGLVCETLVAGHVERLVQGAPEPAVVWRTVDLPSMEDLLDRPEAVVQALTDAGVGLLEEGACDLLVISYSVADLACHLRQVPAVRRAVEALDAALPPLVRTTRRAGATMLLTACHGGIEDLGLNVTASPMPAHSANPVPLILIDDELKGFRLPSGQGWSLADIGATLLGLLEVAADDEVAGRYLLDELLSSAGDDDSGYPTLLEVSAIDAIAMVIAVTRGAREYYRYAAEASTDADSAVVYRHLGRSEERRLAQLERRLALLVAEQQQEPSVDEAPTRPPAPEPNDAPLEVLATAIREELETYRILTELAARDLDPQGRTVLEQMANEELQFLDSLQKLSESESLRLLAALPPAR